MASILVIDDNPQIRDLIRNVLEPDGHVVREARDGAEGVTLYRQERPDLVLCDIFMPEKDGLEAIRELRAEDPGAKVVAMSGGPQRYGMREFMAMAATFGSVATLAKPFDRATLLSVVQTALGQSA